VENTFINEGNTKDDMCVENFKIDGAPQPPDD
jgi:hypothetical protein